MHESTQCINALTCAACREWREEEESNNKKITVRWKCINHTAHWLCVAVDVRSSSVWRPWRRRVDDFWLKHNLSSDISHYLWGHGGCLIIIITIITRHAYFTFFYRYVSPFLFPLLRQLFLINWISISIFFLTRASSARTTLCLT